MKKALIIFLSLIVVIGALWYFVAPAFKVVEVQEESPLVFNADALAHMDEATKKEFHDQMESTKDIVTQSSQPETTGATLLAQGDFKPRAHEVEGKALLIEDNGQTIVRFEDFDTINGPNLHIYLSADTTADDFVDLGEIRATRGSVNYEVDSSVDTDKYNKVLVWCVPFSVLFSYAELS